MKSASALARSAGSRAAANAFTRSIRSDFCWAALDTMAAPPPRDLRQNLAHLHDKKNSVPARVQAPALGRLGAAFGALGGGGEQEVEGGALAGAVAGGVDLALHGDDAVGAPVQADAALLLLLGAEAALEQRGHGLFGDAAAVVAHLDMQHVLAVDRLAVA